MKSLLLLAVTLLCCGAGANAQYWQPTPSGTNKNLLSISFGSPQVGYIGGSDSLLLRTLNGGVSWAPVAHSGMAFSFANPDIIHVNFVTAATGFAIVSSRANPVYNGSLYKTTDSGKTWTAVTTGNIAAARTFFFDANNGFEIGSAFFAGKTIIRQTAGVWGPEVSFSFDPYQFFYGIDFRTTQTGIIGGYGGYVYRSFDGGASWDTVKTVVDTMINELRFLSDRTIMAGTDDIGAGILISHDTGRTWQADGPTLTFAYPSIKGVASSPRDSFIAVGHASFATYGIVLWNDGALATSQMAPQRLNAVDMRDTAVAYIVGDSGLIWSNRQAVLAVPAAERATAALYPNPATGRCYTEAPYLHTVRLFDAAGRLVQVLNRPALRHQVSLEGLRPGMYFVDVFSRQGMSVQKKLIVR